MTVAVAENAFGHDPDVWNEQFGRYLLRYAAHRVKHRETAEELVQETYLAALKALKGFQGRCSLRTWLTTILRHKIIDHYHERDRERRLMKCSGDEESEGELESAAEPFTPESRLESKERLERLCVHLDRLPAAMKRILLARGLEGVSAASLCEELKISETSLWVTLHRARGRLKSLLEQNDS